MDEIARRLEHARGIARGAGALALDHFRMREELVVETKADPQDVFTRADREVEAHLRDRIAETFPADGFLGEETGLSEAESRYHWVVDPIDGTSPFIAGLDAWCVSISILEDKRVVAGVIHMPVAGELFATRKGQGTTLNDMPLRLERPSSLKTGLTGLGANFRVPRERVVGFIDRLMAAGGIFVRTGSGAQMLAHVAAGRLAAYYEPHMNSWDCLAGLLMIREAGGRTGPLPDGDRLLDGGPVIAASPTAWSELVALLDPEDAANLTGD